MLSTPRSSCPCLMSHSARAWKQIYNWIQLASQLLGALLTWHRSSLVASSLFWRSMSMATLCSAACLNWALQPDLAMGSETWKAPVNVVLHPCGHHFGCPLVHRLDGLNDLTGIDIHRCCPCNLWFYLQQLGGRVLLELQVVPDQVHVLLGQQQGHLKETLVNIKNENFESHNPKSPPWSSQRLGHHRSAAGAEEKQMTND